MEPTPLEHITDLAKTHGANVDKLQGLVSDMERDIATIRTKYSYVISAAVRKARESKRELSATIELHPEHFTKPRTQEVAGIKFGLQKGKGKAVIADKEATIKAIKTKLPKKVEDLIETTEKLVTKAVNKLSGAELKKIGVEYKKTGDQVVIKSTDDKIHKLIEATLNDDSIEAEV